MPSYRGTFGILYKILENNDKKNKKRDVFVRFSQCILGGTGRLTKTCDCFSLMRQLLMMEQPVVVFQFKCFILPLSKNKKKYMKEQFLFSTKKKKINVTT